MGARRPNNAPEVCVDINPVSPLQGRAVADVEPVELLDGRRPVAAVAIQRIAGNDGGLGLPDGTPSRQAPDFEREAGARRAAT